MGNAWYRELPLTHLHIHIVVGHSFPTYTTRGGGERINADCVSKRCLIASLRYCVVLLVTHLLPLPSSNNSISWSVNVNKQSYLPYPIPQGLLDHCQRTLWPFPDHRLRVSVFMEHFMSILAILGATAIISDRRALWCVLQIHAINSS